MAVAVFLLSVLFHFSSFPLISSVPLQYSYRHTETMK